MGEGCKHNLQEDGAIILDPFSFEEDEFSYNLTVDLSKMSNTELINYNNDTNSTGEIKICTHVTTKKNIAGEECLESSRLSTNIA